MNPPEPGWYRDPYFKNRERYWDGEIWTDESRKLQPALPPGQREDTPAAAAGRHAADPVTAQQPAVTRDPITTQQPATPAPGDTQPIRIFSGGAAGAITILGGSGPAPAAPAGGPPANSGPAPGAVAAGAVAAGATADGSAPAGPVGGPPDTATAAAAAAPTKEEAAANAERVRTVGAAALLGGDIASPGATTAGTPPPTRSVRTPKEPPPDATRRVNQEADPLLGVSMPGTNSAATATAASAAATGTTPTVEEATAKSHRRGLIIAVAAVVVVLAGLGIYLVLGHNSTKGGGGGAKSATNAAGAAAETTLHHKTAQIAIDVKVSSPSQGQTQGPSAVGDFNVAKNQGNLALTVPPSTTPTQMVFDKKTVYVNLGTQLSTVMPGKTWVSGDILQVSSLTQGVGASLSSFERMVGNPAGLLHQLKGSGAKVVSLGNSTFDGTPVQGYTVTLSSAEISKSSDIVPASHTTETVYVASGDLIKAIVIPTTVNTGGQLVNQNTYVVFSNFGVPVTVTVPPSNEVVTIAQYEAAVAKPST